MCMRRLPMAPDDSRSTICTPSGKGTFVVVRAKGFAPQAVSVDPGPADDPPEIAVRLEPGHRIRGRVLDAAGKPIAGVRVKYGHGGHLRPTVLAAAPRPTPKDDSNSIRCRPIVPSSFQLKGYSPLEEQMLALDGERGSDRHASAARDGSRPRRQCRDRSAHHRLSRAHPRIRQIASRAIPRAGWMARALRRASSSNRPMGDSCSTI